MGPIHNMGPTHGESLEPVISTCGTPTAVAWCNITMSWPKIASKVKSSWISGKGRQWIKILSGLGFSLKQRCLLGAGCVRVALVGCYSRALGHVRECLMPHLCSILDSCAAPKRLLTIKWSHCWGRCVWGWLSFTAEQCCLSVDILDVSKKPQKYCAKDCWQVSYTPYFLVSMWKVIIFVKVFSTAE